MTGSTLLRETIRRGRTTIVPVAHDALAARLIAAAGFQAYAIGGLAVGACRYALPDCGILSYGEMFSAVQDTMRGSGLPVIVDAESGYGDGAMVARVVLSYQALGVGAVCIDDHGSDGDHAVAAARIAVAVAARGSGEILIVARTGARPALRDRNDVVARAQALRDAGADVVFLDRVESVADLEAIAASLCGSVPVMTLSSLHEREDPSLRDLERMGISLVLNFDALLMSAMQAMTEALGALASGRHPAPVQTISELRELLGAADWARFR